MTYFCLLAQDHLLCISLILCAMTRAASDARVEEQTRALPTGHALNWVGGAEQSAQDKPLTPSAAQPVRADINSEIIGKRTFTITIVSAISGEHMMSAVDIGPEVKIATFKRSLPHYIVHPTTQVAATRMRFFRESPEEIQDNETVVPQNRQDPQITLKAIIDPRICACGEPNTDLVCMCSYCHFAVCDSCSYDHGERFCGHCDMYCCFHCLQKHDITQGWSTCEQRCSEWLCPKCVASNTLCNADLARLRHRYLHKQ